MPTVSGHSFIVTFRLTASFGSAPLDLALHSRLAPVFSGSGEPGELRQNAPSPIVVPFSADSIPQISPSVEVAGEEPATGASGDAANSAPASGVSPSLADPSGLGVQGPARADGRGH